ncbi:sugar phosphate isomerase/epimerase family protein [Paenibacillus ginsengarvi]|uniref:Sugar phosphate isomerase/epimerase n=1 Tax=Paenibacillus ginsengarvi TaxID=400777 RepID=A0A3B0C748_9BACL|nr:TIM barrel protein [Paenibacillus ginsengarvi]RKN80424.1 sugar phosphate isomerase/epimerase [Paenibacillus ginsengarvi]
MSYLSVSTWSLHRLLGPLRWTVWNANAGTFETRIQEQPEIHTLLELPGEAAKRGYAAVEICHFHFPSTEEAYLSQLGEAFADAGVSLDTLLLDYGDLTSQEERRAAADLALAKRWIDVASACGAKQIRIVAGEALPTDEEALRRSAAALLELAAYGETCRVRVVTENFKPLTSTGSSASRLLELTEQRIGFITDFGNYKGETKYEDIALTTPHSVSVHAKAIFNERGVPDEAEFRQCLDAVLQTGFDGAYVLIYDGPGDMWEGLERVRRIVEPYLRRG